MNGLIINNITISGEFVNAEGETVIDEEEFELIKKLKSLKLQYRY